MLSTFKTFFNTSKKKERKDKKNMTASKVINKIYYKTSKTLVKLSNNIIKMRKKVKTADLQAHNASQREAL